MSSFLSIRLMEDRTDEFSITSFSAISLFVKPSANSFAILFSVTDSALLPLIPRKAAPPLRKVRLLHHKFPSTLCPPTFYSQNDQGESLAADKDSP